MGVIRKLFPAVMALLVFGTLAGLLVWGVHDSNKQFHETLNAMPEGEKLAEYPSPDGEKLLTTHFIDGRGATVAWSVRAEVTAGGSTRNIYYQYGLKDIEARWLDNETVEINGLVLNIYEDTHEDR